MGVHGLKTIVEHEGCGRQVQILSSGEDREYDTCAIDASAMMQWLMRRRDSSSLFGLGSSFPSIFRICSSFLCEWLERNFQVVLFTDGAPQDRKDSTRRQRYRNRVSVARKFHQRLLEKKMPSNFIAPIFRDEILLDVVESLQQQYGIEAIGVISCAGEADDAMAYWASQRPKSLALTDDSDFFVFPNVSSMAFRTITMSKGAMTGHVIETTKLAEHFGLNPKKWVIAAMHLGNDICPPRNQEFRDIVETVASIADNDDALFHYLDEKWAACPEQARACFDFYWNCQAAFEITFFDILTNSKASGADTPPASPLQEREIREAMPFLEPLLKRTPGALRFLYDPNQWCPLLCTDMLTNSQLLAQYHYVRSRTYHLFQFVVEERPTINEYTFAADGSDIYTPIELSVDAVLPRKFLHILPRDVREHFDAHSLPERLYYRDLVGLPDEVKCLLVVLFMLPVPLQTQEFLQTWLTLPKEDRWMALALRVLYFFHPIPTSELILLSRCHRQMLMKKGKSSPHAARTLIRKINPVRVARCNQLQAMLEAALIYIDHFQLLFGVPEPAFTYQLLCPFVLLNVATSREPHPQPEIVISIIPGHSMKAQQRTLDRVRNRPRK